MKHNKSEIFKRAHYLFRTFKSMHPTFGEALSAAWKSSIKKVKAVRERELKAKTLRDFPAPKIATQPDLSNYYSNQRPGAYMGD